MNSLTLWLILGSPFLIGALIAAGIKGCECWSRWQWRRAMRVRDVQVRRYNITAFRGAKDRFL
jgi:hypothetical protein